MYILSLEDRVRTNIYVGCGDIKGCRGGGLPPRALGGGARVRVRVGGRAPPPLLTGARRRRHRRQRGVARAARQRHHHLHITTTFCYTMQKQENYLNSRAMLFNRHHSCLLTNS